MRTLHVLVGLLALTAAWATGCKGPGPVTIVPTEVVAEEEVLSPGFESPEDVAARVWENTDPHRSPEDEGTAVLVPRNEARKAPSLSVSSESGGQLMAYPGWTGNVMLVLFWDVDDLPLPREAFPYLRDFLQYGDAEAGARLEAYMQWAPLNTPATAMAKHVRDLVQEFRSRGVGAIGIVERATVKDPRTGKSDLVANYRLAPLYVRAEKIKYPIYYDDASALKSMAKAAGVKSVKNLPVLFIVDRDLRVRFVEQGFDYGTTVIVPRDSGTGLDKPMEARERIIDNAPPGQRIEDHLTRLLDED